MRITVRLRKALQRALAKRKQHQPPPRVELPLSTAGGGVGPGVDLDSTGGVLAVPGWIARQVAEQVMLA